MEGNNREAMGTFPSGTGYLALFKREKKQKKKEKKKKQSADRVLLASVDRI